jgi:hypothetical protein
MMLRDWLADSALAFVNGIPHVLNDVVWKEGVRGVASEVCQYWCMEWFCAVIQCYFPFLRQRMGLLKPFVPLVCTMTPAVPEELNFVVAKIDRLMHPMTERCYGKPTTVLT